MRDFILAVADWAENFTIHFCKILQIALTFLIFALLTFFSHFFITHLFDAQKSSRVTDLQVYIYIAVGFWLLFNIVFNYVLSYCVGPGSPEDITSEKFREQVEKRCKKCSSRKPDRCHHCSLCGKCILQMDHHCPWMATCIGHLNRRFFVNFLTYLNLGILLILRLINQARPRGAHEVQTFLFVLLLTLGAFCLFHWFLIFSGRTTLQLCYIDGEYKPSCNFRRNLMIIFGTANIIGIFMPLNRKLPYEGFEWEEDLWSEDRRAMNETIPNSQIDT